MADLHSGARSASSGASVPAAVAGVAQQRGLGALLDARHGQPASRTAAAGFGTAGGALIVAIPLDIKLHSMDELSASFSLLHAIFMTCAFGVIAGLAFGIRALIAGSQSYYRYADGLVHLRRADARAITWAEAERLEQVYQRRGRSDVGRVLGYRLRCHGGVSILIPLSRVEGRDRFMDGVIAAARGSALQVG